MDRILAVIIFALFLAQPVAAGAASADPERRSERVQFAKGATSTVIKGQIKGYQYVDYRLRAGAGQTLSVELKTGNGANYFNSLPPGTSDVAMVVGSMAGNRFPGVLQTDGD